ncbi:bifunctional 4-hydroxy-2-oxoglutarate aldolase/2-dehydro-3-deoxy-phosphogluconate aldolase [Flavitalea sp. BT771]|uniref:bifunctional 4-hydroxy-2-oxoglutarate aldolase/2-dehydro-3-deoxy-phosphogluconate aldolase n=1 Tax=Flavitalea sp. BT771 TaxID=3063329 RepID=UPI0026E47D51|nr:bifunctional 4-hydroxy-2-oxoglutarate aldolase/2-dehydro-3-deoxy-phosphogluconate aldolase [Flavitalea sp. BT771]MDO6431095.1 bifunctional 4-hydroxy-2-oxoglutarate aldolase/2-dehydro-3-deoxy-phosphogluconate aldolase [Flavitalea sp. BT771]MDV6220002.1 bifunctional 4-hydroxy-2-oxoglutarate aldolase/2-dehydro-3-deoxy-phosphogluconate aldolase [Flavitalea sp. BT771]
MSGSTTLQQILENKIVAILRGVLPEAVPEVAAALYAGGIRCLEITLNSPDALAVIRNLSVRLGDRLVVGAGTVLDAAEARAAIDAGARFIISPALDIPTILVTKQSQAVSIPGAFTATEILTAYRNGADIIKVFPASVGVGYFRDLRGPLPHIPLMPTGGVNLDNIADYQKAGAVAFGIGSALVDGRQSVTDEYLRRLTETARRFSNAIPHMGKP